MNLLEYIQGNRKGKAAHRLEREAMRDVFLAEALEGYDTVEGDHIRQIALLRTQLSAKTRRVNRLAVAGIAAGLLFFLAVGSYFMLNRENENFVARYDSLSENVSAQKTEDAPVPAAPDTAQTEIPSAVREQKTPAMPPPPAASTTENVIAETVEPPSNEIVAVEELQETPVLTDTLLLARQTQIEEMEAAVAAEAQKPEVDTLTLARQTRPALKTGDGTLFDGLTAENDTERRRTSQKPYPKIGMAEYRKYLKESLIRPATGDCTGAKGIVRVEFNIDHEGKPHNFRIRKKLCDEADREAIRLIENGSLWVGDKNKKITVDVSF
jgi:hypothetical protein